MTAFIYLFVAAALAGCCKAECISPELAVSFQKLRATETDTLILVRYNPATGFSQPSDSIWKYMTVPATDTTSSLVREWLDAFSNWRIVMPSINKEWQVSNMEVKDFNCCGERARRLNSYTLDGQKIIGNALLIER